jgi:protein-S-isoprenylcysteine O-methyltransferase Ste14
MTPYFVGHPIAMALFDGTLAVWAASEVWRALKRRPEATTREYGSRMVITLCFAGGYLLAVLARARVTAAAFPSDAVTFGIGMAMVWAGVALRWWCFRTLGRYFTIDVMTSTDQPVIDSGPYSIVRHPSYAGLLLVFVGGGILLANWLSLVVMIALPFFGLMNRMRVEEAALSATLGDAYRLYAAHRKRLIPFVW